MKDDQSTGRHLVEKGERVIGHIVAIILGFVMMVVGVSLGVTMVLLPLGFLLGIAGLLLVLWGFFFAGPKKTT
jgi:hypothetical protein